MAKNNQTTQPHQYTPQLAKQLLIEGNARFVDSAGIHHQYHNERRQHFLDHQKPFAMILSCSDSRVPAEIIFDCGLGDLFVVRTAGQALDSAVLGTIEFGISVLQVPLMVVLGHQHCGAIEAALAASQNRKRSNSPMNALLDGILPAIEKSRRKSVDEVMVTNVALTTARILTMQPAIQAKIAGNFDIAMATYSMESGIVDYL